MTTLIPVISAIRETWEEGLTPEKDLQVKVMGSPWPTASLRSVACLRLCFALSYLWPASPGIWPCSPYPCCCFLKAVSFPSALGKDTLGLRLAVWVSPQEGPTAVPPTFVNSLPLSLDHLWKWWRQQPRSWIHYGNIGTSGAFIKR